jgi:hypothetical protein
MSENRIDPRIKKFKNIITINPYINQSYRYKEQVFKKQSSLSYDDKNFVIAYIANKDLIIATIDIGYSGKDDELDEVISLKAYEELGLDEEKEYFIKYEKASLQNDSGLYNLFIIEPELLSSRVEESLQTTQYIDLVTPAPLLYRTLYVNNMIEKNSVDCFIYFSMKDAFVAVYKDGEYLYSRSMEYSLDAIYQKYCASIGEKIDEKEFFDMLESDGLKSSNSTFQKNLMRLFSEIFLQINDIIIYAKRAFGIDRFDKLFLGSVKGPIIGLNDYGYNYLGVPTFNMDFKFDFKNDEWYVDQMQYMMVKSGFDYINSPSSVLNLTQTPRPPIFAKRASGQFLISLGVVSIMAIGWPVGYLLMSYFNEAHIIQLTSQESELSAEVSKYKQILGDKQKVIKEQNAQIKILETTFNNKAMTLKSIYDKKVNYKPKTGLLDAFAVDLTRNGVQVEDINSSDNNFSIAVVSKDDKKITQYINQISLNYGAKISHVDIPKIVRDVNDSYYRGVVEVDYNK